MKKIALIVLSAVILFAAPSCKKQHSKLVKHVVSEEYVYAEPCDENVNVDLNLNAPKAKKEAKTPCLWRCEAKHLVKDVLKENKVIDYKRTVPLVMGYYECNCTAARELLYKAQVNDLVYVDFSDIKNHQDQVTYWVEAALTPKGKALIVESDKPFFAEDTIKDYSVVSPNSGKNKYGEYTFDYVNVQCEVADLVRNFYTVYIANKDVAILDFGTKDLILAQQRILKAKELGVRKRVVDPFTRNHNFAAADIEALKICKWTEYVDLYIVTIAGQEFCLVVKEEDGVKKIDDVALNTPALLETINTMRYFALEITAKELHDAQKLADVKPSRPQRLDPVAPSVVNAPATPLMFDEYAPVLMPGIELVVRPKTIPYDLAKLAEDTLTVDLLAFNKKMVKFGKLKDVKDIAVPTKKAEIAIKTVKVSPLGRICYGEKEGEVEKYVAFFQYVDQEWICVGIQEKVAFPVSANPADNPQLYFEKVAEITPAVSKKLNDCPKCK